MLVTREEQIRRLGDEMRHKQVIRNYLSERFCIPDLPGTRAKLDIVVDEWESASAHGWFGDKEHCPHLCKCLEEEKERELAESQARKRRSAELRVKRAQANSQSSGREYKNLMKLIKQTGMVLAFIVLVLIVLLVKFC